MLSPSARHAPLKIPLKVLLTDVPYFRGNSRGVFGRKNLQGFKEAFFVLSTRKT